MIALLITHHSEKVVKVTHFGSLPNKGQRKCHYKWRTKTGKIKTGMAINYGLYDLDNGRWDRVTYDCYEHPDWIRDPMLVAIKAAEVRDI